MYGVLYQMTIENLTRDEAVALLKELKKVDESLEKFEKIDTTIYDSIVRRNQIDQKQEEERKNE